MGEARRRQEASAQPLQYLDTRANELRLARNGGDPEAYLDSLERREQPSVPCNGCTTCCYHTRVDVHPNEESPADLAHLSVETDPDGTVWLRKRADGACIHLGDSGCAVYEHRPQACRRYDCRIWSLFGVTDGMTGDRHTPFWAFVPRSRRGRVYLTAYQTAGMLAAAKLEQEGRSASAPDVARRAREFLPDLLSSLDAVSRGPQEDWLGAFGFDPRGITEESFRQAQRGHAEGAGAYRPDGRGREAVIAYHKVEVEVRGEALGEIWRQEQQSPDTRTIGPEAVADLQVCALIGDLN